ncbi:MAG: hypothetical protein M0Z77_00850 [Thermoplasmatales archaeon]|nr:hypothetical protein [Thermoplasmatales archaeon]
MSKKGNVNICPNCSSRMERRLAPFKYHGMYIGRFDAYVCSFCHRTYFTEKTYKEVMDLPLNPDNYSDFSEEVNLPSVKSFSIFILLKKRKPQTSALIEENGVLEAITEPVGYKGNVKEVIVQEVS